MGESMVDRKDNLGCRRAACRSQPNRQHQARRGVSLLLCIFVMAMTTVVVVGMYQTLASEFAAIHNTTDYERALYLAGAGVHEALAELEEDSRWLGTISSTELPAGSGFTYSATTADGGTDTVIVTGTGTSGAYTRNLQVTLTLE
jgi:type II secretory pathway component PulK